MKLLLDTHVWLWALLQPDEIGGDAATALRDQTSELWLSPISVWELLMLAERGKVQLDRPPSDWAAEALDGWPLRDAPLNRAVALRSRSIELPHGDPADRFIAATAQEYDLVLVTRDARLLASGGLKVLPA